MTANVGTYFENTITLASSGSGGYSESKYTKGNVYKITENVAIEATDADADTFTVGVIPSSAVIQRGSSDMSCTAITGGTDYDLGIHEIDLGATNWIGAAVDADLFTDGDDLSSAADGIDPFQSIAAGDMGKPLWELLGLSADTKKSYLIVLTANTAGTAAGNVYLELGYTV